MSVELSVKISQEYAQEKIQLFDAVRVGNNREVELLLNGEVCLVNCQDDQGDTPLHHAARKGNKEMISLLLEKGAFTNTVNKKKEKAYHLIPSKDRTIALLFIC